MKPLPVIRYCVPFCKEGVARFLSQLDLQVALETALRRARLPLAYSRGFRPRPRLHFGDALPLGWSSVQERFWMELRQPYSATEALLRLRCTVPPGVTVSDVFLHPAKPRPLPWSRFELVGVALPEDAEERIQELVPPYASESWVKLNVGPQTWGFAVAHGRGPAPRKVVRALLGEEASTRVHVHRLPWGENS